MAWRLPINQTRRTLFVMGEVIDVKLVPAKELQDIFSDADDEHQWGGWHDGTNTIYLLDSAPEARKNRTFWHEVAHMVIDHLDQD